MEKSQPQPDGIESPDPVLGPERISKAQYEKALRKLKGKDAVGRAGEVLGSAGGAVAGASAAGAIAAAAGATTLLGSTTLAGVLGGVFVTATPVGWIIGSAAVAGLAAFGLAKMIRSGTRQDAIREKLADSIKGKVRAMDSCKPGQPTEASPRLRLNLKLAKAVNTGALTEENSRRILLLVEKNALSVDVALDRVGKLSRGINT